MKWNRGWAPHVWGFVTALVLDVTSSTAVGQQRRAAVGALRARAAKSSLAAYDARTGLQEEVTDKGLFDRKLAWPDIAEGLRDLLEGLQQPLALA